MATKTISITEEAYESLASRKNGKESFSDIINKITGKVKLDEFYGILTKKTADEIEDNIKRTREINKKLRIKKIESLKIQLKI
ncbi:hypothetical protein CL617_01075 [archaeon]|nr:hypothetical protein [archaeon]